MNKGVPLIFDFGDASASLTGERVAVPDGQTERPIAKCRSITSAEFGLCLEGYVQDVNENTDTMIVQTDIVRPYPNLGIFVASFQVQVTRSTSPTWGVSTYSHYLPLTSA